MRRGSIGNIAKRKIQWAIDNIESSNLNIADRKKWLYIINNIGDNFLERN